MIYCRGKTALIPKNEILLVWEDFNCHVERYANWFKNVRDNQGLDTRNIEGFRLLDLCTAVNLANTNTYFLNRKHN